MDKNTERERIQQIETLQSIDHPFSSGELITVYGTPASGNADEEDHFVCCALVPTHLVQQSLTKPRWVLRVQGGLPGSETDLADGKERTQYLRFGNSEGIEPLITVRSFHGLREDSFEILEEFRHFHNLYHDATQGTYIKFSDAGQDEVVAKVDAPSRRVHIRLKEIRQFLAIREMHLAIQFDHRAFSKFSLSELELEEETIQGGSELSHWKLDQRNIHWPDEDHRTSSVLRGIRFIEPFDKSKSGFPGFAEEPIKKYVDFLLGLDSNGDEIEFSCDPALLSKPFGVNPNSTSFLTKVDFHKEVLDKYYSQSSLYEVAPGSLQMASLWYIDIDNFHDDKVSAWLGDLGERLPYEEQLHWRSYNITSGTAVSDTFYDQQLLAEPIDPDRPEHLFMSRYEELNHVCDENLNWRLLLPLDEDDQHHLHRVRVPSTNEQVVFDDLVISLTKVIVDSINEQKLKDMMTKDELEACKGSINRLETVLNNKGITDTSLHVQFLRNLQSLRSTGSAHRKGRKYRRAAKSVGIGEKDLQAVFESILEKIVAFLEFLIFVVSTGVFGTSNSQNN